MFRSKPVTRLHLHGGDALLKRSASTLPRELGEFGSCGAAGGVDRCANATRLIRLTGHPGDELIAAVTGKHQVAMAVDEPGQHTHAPSVDAAIGGDRVGLFYRRDPAAFKNDGSVAHETKRSLTNGWVIGDEESDVVDDC